MNPPHTATSPSVTCETHDEAVVHCLTALAHYAEHSIAPAGSNGGAPDLARIPAPSGWERTAGRVTFHFSDQARRGLFLGEATRLLSGKWIRIDLS